MMRGVSFYGLLLEPNSLHKILELRVGAQRIEAWSQKDARIKSFFITLLEPPHRLILIAESCIYHGNFRGVLINRV